MVKLINDLYIDVAKDCDGTYRYALHVKSDKTEGYIGTQGFWRLNDCVDYAIDYTIKKRIKGKECTIADVVKIAQEVNDEFKEIKELCKNL